MGVWIETQLNEETLDVQKVTPYVGVWIETIVIAPLSYRKTSLLMWECGLKPIWRPKDNTSDLSLLMWECGLKQFLPVFLVAVTEVTPYVGVWIET